jgi:hypothetical protein
MSLIFETNRAIRAECFVLLGRNTSWLAVQKVARDRREVAIGYMKMGQTPLINPPQGAILSVGAGEARAVVRDGQVIIRTLMTVTLTCDHRVIDGAIGARWLAAFRALIEDPVTMIV